MYTFLNCPINIFYLVFTWPIKCQRFVVFAFCMINQMRRFVGDAQSVYDVIQTQIILKLNLALYIFLSVPLVPWRLLIAWTHVYKERNN